jgi:hypothetical protein
LRGFFAAAFGVLLFAVFFVVAEPVPLRAMRRSINERIALGDGQLVKSRGGSIELRRVWPN